MILIGEIVYGNSVADWGLAIGIALATAAAIVIAQRVGLRYLSYYARRTDTNLDDALIGALRKTRLLLLLPLAAYAGAQSLTLPPRPASLLSHVAVLALLLQAGIWANRFIVAWLARAVDRRRERDAAGATTLTVLGFVARLIVWALVLLLALDNLGFNISALLAGLGIGGIAVALAAQNILGDLFASLSIVLDKPFVIGDFIIVGELMGTVEYIGLKTTRIRSLSGEQIVFSNTDILNSRIRNYKRMVERRVLFGFGVVYQTPARMLELIPALVREIVTAIPGTRFDRAHFKEFGDSSLNFEVVYYVLSADYGPYMDIQQTINLALFRRFEELGVDFAYPTRTLYLQNAPGPDPTGETNP